MAKTISQLANKQSRELIRDSQQEEEVRSEEEFTQFLTSLPKERGWRSCHMYFFQGFWCYPEQIRAIISMQNHFQPQDTDVILATVPKSGTTWLKALAFAVINRKRFPVLNNVDNHPLLTSNPHDLVPFLEFKLYANNQIPDLIGSSHLQYSPRLFATHVPLSSLPASVTMSECRIVYICRNPFDTFVSQWHFISKSRPESLGPLPLEEAFDLYCKGVVAFGPYWEHMLGYWNETLRRSDKVLFLKYEDLKEDIDHHLKQLARFLGCPFTIEEESEGVVQEMARLCSFEKLKGLEVNKKGRSIAAFFENKHLFRKGEVGDWVNWFTEDMTDALSKIMQEKLSGLNLSFKVRD